MTSSVWRFLIWKMHGDFSFEFQFGSRKCSWLYLALRVNDHVCIREAVNLSVLVRSILRLYASTHKILAQLQYSVPNVIVYTEVLGLLQGGGAAGRVGHTSTNAFLCYLYIPRLCIFGLIFKQPSTSNAYSHIHIILLYTTSAYLPKIYLCCCWCGNIRRTEGYKRLSFEYVWSCLSHPLCSDRHLKPENIKSICSFP